MKGTRSIPARVPTLPMHIITAYYFVKVPMIKAFAEHSLECREYYDQYQETSLPQYKELYKQSKQLLPNVTFAVKFRNGTSLAEQNIEEYTGLMPLDLDKGLTPEDISRIRNEFINTVNVPFVPLLIYSSPSGMGLKAVVAYGQWVENYKTSFQLVAGIINEKFDWGIDTNQSDPLRRSFLAYDKDAWLNPRLLQTVKNG